MLTAPVWSKKQELLGQPVLAGHGGDLSLLGPIVSQTEPVGQQAANSKTGEPKAKAEVRIQGFEDFRNSLKEECVCVCV